MKIIELVETIAWVFPYIQFEALLFQLVPLFLVLETPELDMIFKVCQGTVLTACHLWRCLKSLEGAMLPSQSVPPLSYCHVFLLYRCRASHLSSLGLIGFLWVTALPEAYWLILPIHHLQLDESALHCWHQVISIPNMEIKSSKKFRETQDILIIKFFQ